MNVLAENKIVALGRMLFVPKGQYSLNQLAIEATGEYRVSEKDDCFVIQNLDCCKSIMVTVRARD